MDFLRRVLRERDGTRVLCFSGRGGEIPAAGHPDAWRVIDREQVKRRFRDGDADLLLCTDAASEGLNFQFCGALVNYDMPWNPMRVEQRIGRIDRVGQSHATIRVVNLHYEGNRRERRLPSAAPPDRSLRAGRRPPAAHSRRNAEDYRRRSARRPRSRRPPERRRPHRAQRAATEEQSGFDIDAALDAELALPERPPASVTLAQVYQPKI